MNDNAAITFWGDFASPVLERKFRNDSLVEDVRLTRFLILVFAFGSLMFALNDWRLYGHTPVFLVFLGARSLMLTYLVVCFLRLRHPVSVRQLDRGLLAGLMVVLPFVLYMLGTRPSHWMNHALSVLLIVSVSLLVPTRFSLQAWAATLFASAAMGLLIAKNPNGFTVLANLMTLSLAVVVGLVASRKLHTSRRESFAARLAQRETIGKLEAALVEVRRLEGILPICSCCKKIRQEDGDWAALEEYVTERSEARFSHGICPTCREEHYPEFSPGLQSS